MTSLTEAAQAIDIEFIRSIGWLLNDTVIYGVVLLALIFLGESRT